MMKSLIETAALIMGVWFRFVLVHIRNVPLAQHQAGHRRTR